MSIILDAIRTLLFRKQKEGESLQDYTKRFRVAQDVLKSHMGGTIILTKFVEAMDGYKEINFANKLSVNLRHIYISIMPTRPNTDQL